MVSIFWEPPAFYILSPDYYITDGWEIATASGDDQAEFIIRHFALYDGSLAERKENYLALAITPVDILDRAADLFDKDPAKECRNDKAEPEQYRYVLEQRETKNNDRFRL